MMEGTMKDCIGQEIKVGSKILWMGGKTQYAGSKVLTVEKVTAKKVGFYQWSYGTSRFYETLSYVDPECVVVIDLNLNQLSSKNKKSPVVIQDDSSNNTLSGWSDIILGKSGVTEDI